LTDAWGLIIEKENEIQALILKKNKLGIKQKAIEKIHMDVTMLKGTFDSIVDRLGALEAIWNMVCLVPVVIRNCATDSFR